MVVCKNIRFSYGQDLALDDISLKLEEHGTMAIIGPSGCGKTTLLYCLAGLHKPQSGSIMIDDEPLTGIRLKTSVILQDHGIFPWKTVYSNILLAQKTRYEVNHDKIDQLLRLLEIEDKRQVYPKHLSGGQRQRVGIARALATDPSLLLMDEPTSSLDAITKEKFQELLLQIYKQQPLKLIFVTHDIEEAVYLGKKICVMKDKKVKTIIDNPVFGSEDARHDMNFYKVCMEVRKALEE